MGIRRKEIIEGKEFFHVINRGVDGRDIFSEEVDYLRFIHDMFEFNDREQTLNLTYRFKRQKTQSMELGAPYMKKSRKLLVEILAFCLMPNHFHLLLRQKTRDGIIKFMQKIGGGYVSYFNLKHERTGTLFQSRYKLVPVENENHLFHLAYYFHLNPLDLIEPQWREGKIKNYAKAKKFLESYRWSSHLDFIGRKNFPSVTQRDFLLKILGGAKNYQKGIEAWLREMEWETIADLAQE